MKDGKGNFRVKARTPAILIDGSNGGPTAELLPHVLGKTGH